MSQALLLLATAVVGGELGQLEKAAVRGYRAVLERQREMVVVGGLEGSAGGSAETA